MNRSLLTCVLIFVLLSFFASASFACIGRPVAEIAGSVIKYTLVWDTIYFDGWYPYYSHDTDDFGYCIVEYLWYLGTEPPAYEQDQWYGDAECEYHSPGGPYVVSLTVWDNDTPQQQSEWTHCYVYAVDMTLSGGGDVAVGDLVEIQLSFEPSGLGGETELEALGPKKHCIKVWKEETKQTLLIGDGTYSKTWDPDEMPTKLWVEGISPTGDTYQAKLALLYYPLPPSDTYLHAGYIYFTVVCVDPIAVLEHYPDPERGDIGLGETIYFDGSGSFDPDGGGIKKYEWDWDNDGTYDYEENPGNGIAEHSFTTGGTKTVTLRVTDDDAAEGGPPDKSDTDSVTFEVCSKPHVLDFWKKTVFEDPDGVLVFIYQWSSTHGTISDLDGLVAEIVEYPGSDDPYEWPPPWDFSTPNPTKSSISASEGLVSDSHLTGSFVLPYQSASFSASQKFGFHCNECMPSGKGIHLMGPHSIDRRVYWVPPASTWRYKIEKTGASAEKDLP